VPNIIEYAAQYAEACYVSSSPLDCRLFVHPKISWTEEFVECPFASYACSNASRAIAFDTGHIRLVMYGINHQEAQTTSLRRRLTCPALRTELYETYPRSDGGILYRYFNFSTDSEINYSYASGGNLNVRITRNANSFDYEVVMATRTGWKHDKDPSIHPSLNRSDAEVTLVLINKEGIRYRQPIDDPLYDNNTMSRDLCIRF
jgi:hypothetical protein